MPAEPGGWRLELDDRALRLGYRLGSDALLVLLDLAAHASDSPDGMVVSASYRDIARRLGISKDTVGRRVALLRRDGFVVERTGSDIDRFETRTYRLHLDLAGVMREPMRVGP
jgi:DNA-binding MarR family transcriptional regulator